MALDRERIVRTALQLLNDVGLDGLTVRRIAQELGVQAPTLYWHVNSKQALLDDMATTMLKDLIASGEWSPDGPWQESLVGTCRCLRRMLLGYRDGAKVFSGTYLTDDALLGSMEVPLRKLADAGFSPRDAVRGWSTLYGFVIGFTIEEQAVKPLPGERDERYDLATRARRIDGARFPLTIVAGRELFTEFDDRFEHGLRLIVSGLERLLPSDSSP